MVGISFPGISQLFVASTHPPSLAAITPLAVISGVDTTMNPGGIVNDGFAVEWASQVLDRADPYGHGWEQGQVDDGDLVCEENQLLHSQKVDIIQKAYDNPFYTPGDLRPAQSAHLRRRHRHSRLHQRRLAGRADRRPLPGSVESLHERADRPLHRLQRRPRRRLHAAGARRVEELPRLLRRGRSATRQRHDPLARAAALRADLRRARPAAGRPIRRLPELRRRARRL